MKTDIELITSEGKRLDGRGPEDIRKIKEMKTRKPPVINIPELEFGRLSIIIPPESLNNSLVSLELFRGRLSGLADPFAFKSLPGRQE